MCVINVPYLLMQLEMLAATVQPALCIRKVCPMTLTINGAVEARQALWHALMHQKSMEPQETKPVSKEMNTKQPRCYKRMARTGISTIMKRRRLCRAVSTIFISFLAHSYSHFNQTCLQVNQGPLRGGLSRYSLVLTTV